MKIDFDEDQDSRAQAAVLIQALTDWLAEQPPVTLRPGKADYCYRPDGTLDSITTTLVGD
jgi:hypothetical protein